MRCLWVDDVVTPPPNEPDMVTWRWAKNSTDAIFLLRNPSFDHSANIFDFMSLDHDLGGDDTAKAIIAFLIEHPRYWPTKVAVHSRNPVGKRWLIDSILQHHPEGFVRTWTLS